MHSFTPSDTVCLHVYTGYMVSYGTYLLVNRNSKNKLTKIMMNKNKLKKQMNHT